MSPPDIRERFVSMLENGIDRRRALRLLHRLGRAERIAASMDPPLVLLGPGGEYRNPLPTRAERAVVYLALGLFVVVAWAMVWVWLFVSR